MFLLPFAGVIFSDAELLYFTIASKDSVFCLDTFALWFVVSCVGELLAAEVVVAISEISKFGLKEKI